MDWAVNVHGDVGEALQLCVFGVSLVGSAWLLDAAGGSGLLGYLFAGLLLGPQVLDFVPQIDSIRVLGRIGVAFLLLEAGLHIDKAIVRQLGLRAFGLTLAGMTTPLLGGMVVMYVLGYTDLLQAFGVGACFMPTSVGMSVQILADFNELDTLSGQMIVVVAMIDDILSLVVLAVIEQLGGHKAIMSSEGHDAILASEPSDDADLEDGEFNVLGVLQPMFTSAVFAALLLAWSLAHHKWIATAKAIDDDFGRYCHILMLLEALALGAATCTYSTELLGVFFAGFAFSTRPEVRHEFEVKSLPVMKWLGMAFFASLGFSVPLDAMLSWKMWFSGLLMTVPSVCGKLFTGMCFMRDQGKYDGCKVGWGRVGRGEFAFYLADVGHSVGIVGTEAYAITVWALLNGSMGFPWAFRDVMKRAAALEVEDSDSEFDSPRVRVQGAAKVQGSAKDIFRNDSVVDPSDDEAQD